MKRVAFVVCLALIIMPTVAAITLAPLKAKGTPGKQLTYLLNALSTEAGASYYVGASFGDRPGIQIGGRIVPLNMDPLLVLSLTNSIPFFQNFQGILDSNGNHEIKITIPNEQSLVGVKFYIAGIVVQGSNIGTITNAAEVEIVQSDAETVGGFGALPMLYRSFGVATEPMTDSIHIFGGFVGDPGLTDAILKADFGQPLGDQIDVLPDRLPSARQGAAAVFFPPDGRFYIFGGSGQTTALTEIVVYNPSRPPGQRISIDTRRTLPVGGNYRAAVVGNAIYLFPTNSPTDVYEYLSADGSLRQYTNVLPSSYSFGTAGLTAAGTNIILCCTSNGNIVTFDTITKRGRTETATLPSGGRNFPSVVYDATQEKVLIIGGVATPSPPSDEVFSYDPRTNQVNLATRLPLGKYGAGAVFLDQPYDLTLLLGGATPPNSIASREIVVIQNTGGQYTTRPVVQIVPRRSQGTLLSFPDLGMLYYLGGRTASNVWTDEILSFAIDSGGLNPARIDPLRLPQPQGYILSVVDDTRNVAYLLGGATESGFVNQIFRFDPRVPSITLLSATLPESLGTVYDNVFSVWVPEQSVAYVFGGRDAQGSRRQIWRFDPTANNNQGAVTVLPVSLPVPGANPTVSGFYEPERRLIYLMRFNRAPIVFDPYQIQITELTTPVTPSLVSLSTHAVYSNDRKKVYIFSDVGQFSNPVVVFDIATMSVSQIPFPLGAEGWRYSRYGFEAVYDINVGKIVLFGEFTDGQLFTFW